jgi:hypothetical protein
VNEAYRLKRGPVYIREIVGTKDAFVKMVRRRRQLHVCLFAQDKAGGPLGANQSLEARRKKAWTARDEDVCRCHGCGDGDGKGTSSRTAAKAMHEGNGDKGDAGDAGRRPCTAPIDEPVKWQPWLRSQQASGRRVAGEQQTWCCTALNTRPQRAVHCTVEDTGTQGVGRGGVIPRLFLHVLLRTLAGMKRLRAEEGGERQGVVVSAASTTPSTTPSTNDISQRQVRVRSENSTPEAGWAGSRQAAVLTTGCQVPHGGLGGAGSKLSAASAASAASACMNVTVVCTERALVVATGVAFTAAGPG